MENFPITKVVKGAWLAPINNPGPFFLGLLALIGSYFAAFVVGAVIGFIIALVVSVIGLGQKTASIIIGVAGGLAGALFVGTTFAMVFNYWVRYGAGVRNPTCQAPMQQAIVQGLKNLVKFVLVGVVMVILYLVLAPVLGLLGVETIDFQEILDAAQNPDVPAPVQNRIR